jgi:hypothetical protein
VAPAVAQVKIIEIEADYAQYIYATSNKGQTLQRSRAIDIAEKVDFYCGVYDQEPDWLLPQFGYESAFLNCIRDRNLKFKSWSYGYTGIQIDTAKDLVKYLGLPYDINGRDLIANFDMNIELGVAQMANLYKHNYSFKRAIMAYNVGQRGMEKGNGKGYYKHIKEAHDFWMKFKKQELK